MSIRVPVVPIRISPRKNKGGAGNMQFLGLEKRGKDRKEKKMQHSERINNAFKKAQYQHQSYSIWR